MSGLPLLLLVMGVWVSIPSPGRAERRVRRDGMVLVE
jgi:hypothetical protein